MRTRAERRHHFYRIRKRVYNFVKHSWDMMFKSEEELKTLVHHLEQNKKMCNCYMCSDEFEKLKGQKRRELDRATADLKEYLEE